MAELTLAQIRAAVRFRGDYTNVRKFPNEDVDAEIQRSFGKFWQIVDEVNQGWWDTYGSVVTTAGVEYVAPPTGAWSVKDVKRLDGSDYVDMRQISAQMRNRYGSSRGEPCAYFLAARGIELAPIPDGVYTLRVLYTPKAPLLQESQPREWYNGWDSYVIECTLLELDKRERKPLTDRLTALEIADKALRAGASKRREQEPEYLNLHEAAVLDTWGNGEI